MKKLITFLAIAFFAQLGFAQDYTMSIEDNYLVMVEVATGDEEIEIPRKDVRFRTSNTTGYLMIRKIN